MPRHASSRGWLSRYPPGNERPPEPFLPKDPIAPFFAPPARRAPPSPIGPAGEHASLLSWGQGGGADLSLPASASIEVRSRAGGWFSRPHHIYFPLAAAAATATGSGASGEERKRKERKQ